jgi:fibro-slime domain-containing protein
MNKQTFLKLLVITTSLVSTLVPQIALTQTTPQPDSMVLTGTIRDFKAYRLADKNLNPAGGHQDFQRYASQDAGFNLVSEHGVIVDDILGADKKPVYKPGVNGTTVTTTTKENFDMWYRDVDTVNKSMELSIELADLDNDGVYSFARDLDEAESFFPIDNQLFGNEGYAHNYHFTYELHTQFTYVPGTADKPRFFTFKGDDDVYVFINGKKVIDLGGIHVQETETVNLDLLAPQLGLVAGQTYDLDLFFAERNVVQSNFRIDTSIVLKPKTTEVVYAD